MKKYSALGFLFLVMIFSNSLASEYLRPWQDADAAIILDPFSGNSIDWDILATDKKVVAIIHKASQGRNADRMYPQRKHEATRRGYLWGSYHLLTSADAKAQIDRYLEISGISDKETYALVSVQE